MRRKASMRETEKEAIKVTWYQVSEPVESSLHGVSDTLLNGDVPQSLS